MIDDGSLSNEFYGVMKKFYDSFDYSFLFMHLLLFA